MGTFIKLGENKNNNNIKNFGLWLLLNPHVLVNTNIIKKKKLVSVFVC